MTTCHYILVKIPKGFGPLDVLTKFFSPLTETKVLGNMYFNVVELTSAMLLGSSEVYEAGE